MNRQQIWTDLDVSERQVILENVREKRKLTLHQKKHNDI